MALRAVLDGGRRVTLAARYGDSPATLADALTRDALTGSAVPLDSARVELADGSTVPYGTLTLLDEEQA